MAAKSAPKSLLILSLLTLAVTVCVIGLGSWTRLMDSGLGCPDWPTCYGFIDVRHAIDHVNTVNEETPNALREAHKTVPEMVHRYFASFLGLLIVIIACFSTAVRRRLPGGVGLAWFLVALVIFQGILGKWTVTMGLYPPTVVGHLLGGFTTLTLLFLLFLQLAGAIGNPDGGAKKLKTLFVVAFFAVIVQIALGGWTAANYAAAVCTQLPVCEPGWLAKITPGNLAEAFGLHGFHEIHDYEFGVLDHDARVVIHAFHRLGAWTVLILVGVLAWQLHRRATTPWTRQFALLLAAVLSVQILLGIANVLLQIPIAIAVLHNAGGALLMLTMAFGYYRLYFKERADG